MPNDSPPPWTDDEIILVRRMARNRASTSQIRIALAERGMALSETTLRKRARTFGISIVKMNSAHHGTSELQLPLRNS